MALDNSKLNIIRTDEKPVFPGVTLETEGVLLQSVIDPATGSEAVKLATVTATDKLAGFLIDRSLSKKTRVLVEQATVSAGLTVTLSHANVVSGTIRVQDLTAGSDAIPASVDYVAGVITLAAGTAGHLVQVTYVYNLTVREAEALYHTAPIGSNAPAVYGIAVFTKGPGEIYLDTYDTTKDYSAAGVVLRAGAAGIVTIGGTGATIPGSRVTHVPSPANPFLGLAFNF